ncbi:MAG: hypothetical protein ACJAQ0_001559 [Dasania sp.]|jgi:hypothetical protein
MRNNFVSIALLLTFGCIFPLSVNAFEPVSIDDFFKKYTNEVQGSGSGASAQDDFYKRPVTKRVTKRNPKDGVVVKPDNNKSATIDNYNADMTAFEYPIIHVLVLDRILGRSKIVKFNAGQTQLLAHAFNVTINNCIQRKTEFENATHSVSMLITDTNNKPQSKLYNDIFYLEMPGFRAFENVTYDIKPIKCVGEPKKITLDTANSLNVSYYKSEKPPKSAGNQPEQQQPEQQEIETIISNANIGANLTN